MCHDYSFYELKGMDQHQDRHDDHAGIFKDGDRSHRNVNQAAHAGAACLTAGQAALDNADQAYPP